MKRKKSILVTGAPRSGTTFVGKMLALPRDVAYVDEPFNSQTGMQGIDTWFPYMHVSESDPNEKLVKDILNGKTSFKSSQLRPDATNPVRQLARELFVSRENVEHKINAYNPIKRRFLIKDPLACFASEYLHQKFDCHTLVVLRHPASTIASFKRLGWRFHLGELQKQTELMKHHLEPIIGHLDPDKIDNVEEWAHLWLSINKVLETYASRNKDMTIVRHEDLSSEPIKEFAGLYDKYDLKFTPRVQEKIKAHTGAENPAEPTGNAVHVLKRNSAENIKRWKKILTEKEIEIIREITEPFSQKYYTQADW